jgi:hypothetical protein
MGITRIRDLVNYISSAKEGINPCQAYGPVQDKNPVQNQN